MTVILLIVRAVLFTVLFMGTILVILKTLQKCNNNCVCLGGQLYRNPWDPNQTSKNCLFPKCCATSLSRHKPECEYTFVLWNKTWFEVPKRLVHDKTCLAVSMAWLC